MSLQPLEIINNVLLMGKDADIGLIMEVFSTKLQNSDEHSVAIELIRHFARSHATDMNIRNSIDKLSALSTLLVDENNCVEEYKLVCELIQDNLRKNIPDNNQ